MKIVIFFITILTLSQCVLGVGIRPSDITEGNMTTNMTYNFSFNLTNSPPYPYLLNITFEPSPSSGYLTPAISFEPSNIILHPSNATIEFIVRISPENISVGNHIFIFRPKADVITNIEAGSGINAIGVIVPVSGAAINFTVKGNRAPVLMKPIPNQTWKQDRSLTGLNLSEYFYDPDKDSMNFSAAQPNNINIIIENGIVTFVPDPGWYGVRYTLFRACDHVICITSNIVMLNVTRIIYPPAEAGTYSPPSMFCPEKWNCTDWSECINGTQKRDCIDINNCGTEKYKPVEKRSCKVKKRICKEEWKCGDWGPCINGTQIRECVDVNKCGTEKQRPQEKRKCKIEMPTPVEQIPAPPLPLWPRIALWLLISLIAEFYTYYMRHYKKLRTKPLIPLLISLIFVFIAIIDYINSMRVPLDVLKKLLLEIAVIAIAAFLVLFVFVRLRRSKKKLKDLIARIYILGGRKK